MRKILISFGFLLASVAMMGQQSISGIRVDGGNTPIIVYVNGNQMNYPATSCFIASLRPGSYNIEVYASQITRPGERMRKGERLLSQRINYRDNKVTDLFVGNRVNSRPNRPNNGYYRNDYEYRDQTMDDQLFQKFYKSITNEPFTNQRQKLIKSALVNSDFTSAQCLQIVKLFDFDNEKITIMKLMYPNIIDKQAFFTVIDELSFSSSKESVNNFIKNYSEQH